MKRNLFLPLLLTAFLMLAVSGLADEALQQLGLPSSFGSSEITVEVPPENEVADGINPLTGEEWSGTYQPIMVNIDAHPDALPHWGVSDADITYEMPIQRDGSTREVALFMGSHPTYAGPVRSARVVMCNLHEMWGGLYCYFGVQGGRDTNNVTNWVRSYSAGKRNAYPYINVMNNNSIYIRNNDGEHVAPHNVRLDLSMLWSEYTETPTPHPFKFTSVGLDCGEDVSSITISYKQTVPSYVTSYDYNESTGLYDRYRNGIRYTDGLNGKECSYANVIVVRTDLTWASGNASRPVYRLDGQGVCEIFQNGKYIRGTWVRDSHGTDNLTARMIFLDSDGNEIPMKIGKTFIQLVDNEQPVLVQSPSAIEGAVAPTEQRLTIGAGRASSAPRATRTPRPTRTPRVSATPKPTASPAPTATPAPTAAPAATVSGNLTLNEVPETTGETSLTVTGSGASGYVYCYVNGVRQKTVTAGKNGTFAITISLEDGENDVQLTCGDLTASFTVNRVVEKAEIWMLNYESDYTFTGKTVELYGYTKPLATVYFRTANYSNNVKANKLGYFHYKMPVKQLGETVVEISTKLKGYESGSLTITLNRIPTEQEELDAFKKGMKSYSYKKLCSWPEGFKEEKISYRGRVMLTQEVNGVMCALVCTRNVSTGYWYDPLWIELTTEDQLAAVKEGEVMTFYTIIEGTYANVSGSYIENGYDTSIPILRLVYYRK